MLLVPVNRYYWYRYTYGRVSHIYRDYMSLGDYTLRKYGETDQNTAVIRIQHVIRIQN